MSDNQNERVKPLFKYIGGKTWLRNQLREEVDHLTNEKSFKGYVEPFCGGLGAFLGIYDILKAKGINNIVLNDINEHLPKFYNTVLNEPDKLIQNYMTLEQGFTATIPSNINQIDKKDKEQFKTAMRQCESFYKEIRKQFNESNYEDALHSAHLLFLQSHCFNGVYRENSKGKHNVPFNWEAKTFQQKDITHKIMLVHNLFSQFNIQFTNLPFNQLDYSKDNLYYLDPPYFNDNEIIENRYNKSGFGIDAQRSLIEKISKVSFIYSNHASDILLQEFDKIIGSNNLTTRLIPRKNIISASSDSRKNDKMEILIRHKG